MLCYVTNHHLILNGLFKANRYRLIHLYLFYLINNEKSDMLVIHYNRTYVNSN